MFGNQPYLACLYQTLLAIGYYGLFRVGELTSSSDHTILASNVHVAKNKEKILILLYSSKTHAKESPPQKIKITGMVSAPGHKLIKKIFCPFPLIKRYINMRGDYYDRIEPFFVFCDGSHLNHVHVRLVICTAIKQLNLNKKLYDTASLRSGHACDMLKYGFTIEEIKCAGHWKSNAIFKYLKNFL